MPCCALPAELGARPAKPPTKETKGEGQQHRQPREKQQLPDRAEVPGLSGALNAELTAKSTAVDAMRPHERLALWMAEPLGRAVSGRSVQ
jgi:hypothetical protein